MRCEEVREDLSAFLDNELAEEQAQEVAAHLAQCRQCREELEAVKRLCGLVRSLPKVEAPAGFSDRILSELGRQKRERRARIIRVLWPAAAAAMIALAIHLTYPTSPPRREAATVQRAPVAESRRYERTELKESGVAAGENTLAASLSKDAAESDRTPSAKIKPTAPAAVAFVLRAENPSAAVAGTRAIFAKYRVAEREIAFAAEPKRMETQEGTGARREEILVARVPAAQYDALTQELAKLGKLEEEKQLADKAVPAPIGISTYAREDEKQLGDEALPAVPPETAPKDDGRMRDEIKARETGEATDGTEAAPARQLQAAKPEPETILVTIRVAPIPPAEKSGEQ